MDLRSLRHLVTLARRLSYSRAAEDLGISQSALTRSIQSLERQAGMRLFDRDRTGVSLTAQGRAVVERATILLADAEDFERRLRQTARGEDGRIAFGMAPLPAWTLLPAALAGLIDVAPAFTHDVAVRNVEALWPLLIAGDIEFFVSAEGQVPDAPPVRAEALGSFPMTLIVRAGHPLLTGEAGEAAFPVLISSRGGSNGAVPAYLRHNAAGPLHVVEDYGTLVALTKGTDAIWVSSAFAVAEELEAGLLCALDRPPSDAPPPPFRIMIYSLDRRSRSPAMLRLMQAFRQRIQQLAGRTGYNTSNNPAAPMPPPTHIVTTT